MYKIVTGLMFVCLLFKQYFDFFLNLGPIIDSVIYVHVRNLDLRSPAIRCRRHQSPQTDRFDRRDPASF